jgi:hypothetical protein
MIWREISKGAGMEICELHNIDEEQHVMRISHAHRYQVSSIEGGREFPRRVMILPE